MTIKFYEVGGCVRDELLGIPSKDIDFVVIAPSFEAMRAHLLAEKFKIFVEKQEFVTIRASVPPGHPLRQRTRDADFVLARKDSPTSDGRRPDYVEPGTLEDDLARRDFTVNAMARDPLTGEVIDPHNGRRDLESKVLRFVGDPITRLREDALRLLRGLRFMVTKGFSTPDETWTAITSEEAAHNLMVCVSIERVKDELEKMLMADTTNSVRLLAKLPAHTQNAIFREGFPEMRRLRLTPTLKE